MENLIENIARMEQELAEMKAKLEQSQYPIYCKHKDNTLVVKFTGLKEGEVVIDGKIIIAGYKANNWADHTNTEVWQQLEVSRGLFDGQAVWCWDNGDTHKKILRFWDAKNKTVFNYQGKRKGVIHKNIEPFEGNYTEWMLNAFNTLER